ncbi:putative zinc finger C4H2 domain-containing protein-like isoform X1 [Apostichopus japonicus]|uniref:Putative zinc finger C4H2 domain-containing protein-like isoform X1 n=1 Tax=Stichopus japonicus TaxID=307972 RepID=A0A2G8K335_STIJA|nr:putative zinc finger C4H2 domain-containing protein-like isoform X1 [Apostichopus japonicus]
MEPVAFDEDRVSQLMQHMYSIKDIRAQTLQLEKLKVKVLEQCQEMKSEEGRFYDYKNELEVLEEERLAHVEELRQIHADMKAMETVIEEADEDRNRSLELAWNVFKEYNTLKETVNEGRYQLGLEEITPVSVGGDVIDKHYFKRMRSAFKKESNKMESRVTRERIVDDESNQKPNIFSIPSTSTSTSVLKVQIPPMKICQSCQQPIHRNAPVCPLCKAKNKSRHPKKVKRKHDDGENSA